MHADTAGAEPKIRQEVIATPVGGVRYPCAAQSPQRYIRRPTYVWTLAQKQGPLPQPHFWPFHSFVLQPFDSLTDVLVGSSVLLMVRKNDLPNPVLPRT